MKRKLSGNLKPKSYFKIVESLLNLRQFFFIPKFSMWLFSTIFLSNFCFVLYQIYIKSEIIIMSIHDSFHDLKFKWIFFSTRNIHCRFSYTYSASVAKRRYHHYSSIFMNKCALVVFLISSSLLVVDVISLRPHADKMLIKN